MTAKKKATGTETIQTPETSEVDFIPEEFCFDPPSQCPPADHEWAISASMLNILWADLYPRVVAKVIQGGGGWPTPGEDIRLPSSDYPTLGWLRHHINQLRGDPRLPFSEFERRRQLALEYLSLQQAIPIIYRGQGAYDFVLSDQGLDLFAPPIPATNPARPVELFRFYQIRSTGEAPIGMPAFMEQAIPAIQIPSPDGPGQIDFGGAENVIVFCECSEKSAKVDRSAVEIELDLWGYQQYMDERRCWSLEGSVYLGIMRELPRVVATIWYEEASQVTFPAGVQDYRDRYQDQNELREIFKERLETSLPGGNRMEFMRGSDSTTALPSTFPAFIDDTPAQAQSATQPQDGDPYGIPFWNDQDVMITSRGMYFPEVPAQPTENQILDAVIAGRAGNPVFTSTYRCEQ